jgi:hypothetical protein
MMDKNIVVLSRQKPHEVFLFGLAVLSGLAILLGLSEPTSLTRDLPSWVLPVWAWCLLTSSLAGLGGMLYRRDRERGMGIERGALVMQTGMVLMYGLLLVAINGWQAVIAAGAALVWASTNLWEAKLISADLRAIALARRRMENP